MPTAPARAAKEFGGLNREELFELGKARVERFCHVNDIEAPPITAVPLSEWWVNACAYYRPTPVGINICLAQCARICSDAPSRNWNWPGSTTDREPYGVLCHELGHHCDWLAGVNKGRYYSEWCEYVMARSGEQPITSYCPNPAEWLAEIMRLYITNAQLLALIRPKAYGIIQERWKAVSGNWLAELGADVPERVVKALRNKMR